MSRVAFLLGNLTDGGSETKTVRLANRLAARGDDVHILYLGAPHTLRSAIDEPVAVEFLDRRGKFSLGALKRLKAYLTRHEIDTVFCINHYPLVYGWPACRSGDSPRRCIGAMNTYEFTSIRDRFFMLIYAFILRRCERVVFGSRAQERLWTKKYRIDPDKCEVIYNGVDLAYFQGATSPSADPGALPKIEEDAVVVGCVAHLRPEKSHTDLLEATNRLVHDHNERIVLLLIGDGPEEARLRRQVEACDLTEQVVFCGRTNDVRPYLDRMDIFALSSSTEVFSNAVLEAMAMGVPVVCSAVGGSVEMVVDGKTGFTYPRNDVDALVERLGRLIADRSMREAFGKNGAARVRDVFSIERMDEQYRQIISQPSNGKDRG